MLQQNLGDYSRENVILTDLSRPVMTTKNSMGKASQYRQFAVRVERNYALDDGTVIEQQPLDWFCTTWDPAIIRTLELLKESDRVNIQAYVEPTWRGYIADNTPSGIRFPIPDVGSQPYDVPGNDLVVQPTAHPYRLDAQQPGVYTHPSAGLNVMSLVPATNFASAGVTEQPTDAKSAFESLQQQQDGLNEATQPTANGDGAANPHVAGVVVGQ